MNKRRIFSTFISVILGLFCIIPSPKATPPTQPYTDEAFYRFCEFVRKNPDTAGRIFKEIELLTQGVHSDKALIDYENPAKSICIFLSCKESEVIDLLNVERYWFGKKEKERICILKHFLKLAHNVKIQLESVVTCYTEEALNKMVLYLRKNSDSTFFEEMGQIERIYQAVKLYSCEIPSKFTIDLSNPIPDLCKILECSEEELTELLQLQCKGEGLFEKLSPKDKMLNNFFELVRAARLKLLQLNS